MNQPISCSTSAAHLIFFLSPRDIDQLAQFLENAFEHFSQYQSSCEESFLNDIRIIADCYSLIVINIGDQIKQDERLRTFHGYGDFRKYPTSIKKLSFAIAEMINSIADKVRLISYPWFYSHFVHAVQSILSTKIAYLHNKLHLAQSLQHKILNHHACSMEARI